MRGDCPGGGACPAEPGGGEEGQARTERLRGGFDGFDLSRRMIGGALVQIPILVLASNLEGWQILGAALPMMIAVFGRIPINDKIVGKYCADEYHARVLGMRYVISLGAAAGAGIDPG